MADLIKSLQFFLKETEEEEICKLLGVTADNYRHLVSGQCDMLSDTVLFRISNILGVTEQDLNNHELILHRYYEEIKKEKIGIPDKYSEGARSFVRSSSHIVKYLELLYGEKKLKTLLKKMNVHPYYFHNLNNKININFFIDLLEVCRALGFQSSDLRKLSSAMFLSIEGSESEKMFRKCNNLREAYKNISEVVALFDTNFYCDFQLRDDSIVLTTEPHESIVPFLEKSPVDFLFEYRKNVFGTVTSMCQQPMIHLHHSSGYGPTSLTQRYSGKFLGSPGEKFGLLHNET